RVEHQTAIGKMKDTTVVAVSTTTIAAQTTKPVENSPLTVPLRAGETQAQRGAREKLAKQHLDDGKKALDDRQYVDAITLLQAALTQSGRDDYGTTPNEAANLLRQANQAKTAAEAQTKTAAAQKLFADGKALATTDIVAAVRKLRDAQKADPQMAGVADLL